LRSVERRWETFKAVIVSHSSLALKGDSYRLKDRDLGRVPTATTDE